MKGVEGAKKEHRSNMSPHTSTQGDNVRRGLSLQSLLTTVSVLLLLGILAACKPDPLTEADALFDKGLYASAAQRYVELGGASTAAPAVKRRTALSLAWSERAAEAEPLLKALHEQGGDPEVVAAHIDVVAVLRGQREAEALALQALADHPKSSEVIRSAATLAAQRGELAEARELLERALVLDPKNASALAVQGDILMKMKDFPGAIAKYQEAIAIRPQSPLSVRLRVRMAQIIAETSPEQALGLLQEAQIISPDNGEVNAELGKVLSSIGVCSTAIDYLKTAVEQKLERPDIYSTLGYCYLQQAGETGDRQMLNAAKKWFERLLKREPGWRGAYTNLGMVELNLGDQEAAEAAFRQELTLYPNSVEALSNLGRLYNEQGQGARAKEMLQRAFELDHRQVVLSTELGNLAMQASDFSAAQDWYRRSYLLCQDAQPDHPCRVDVPYQLARLAARQKDSAGAAKFFKEALQAGFSDVARFRAEPELKVLETDSDVAAWLNRPR